MATSSTYNWLPSAGSMALQAFARAGLKRTELTAQHMADAESESNFVMVELSNKIPNLWTSEVYSETLVAGTTSYTLPTRIVDIQIAYISTTYSGVTTDRVIMPMSTTEYASIANKANQAPPSTYWFDRQITPVIYMWPVPDASATYVLKLRCLSQFQDTQLKNGTDVEVPYRALDAFTWALSARLAAIYAPERAEALDARAERAMAIMMKEDVENAPVRIVPGIASYYGM